ncbi:hypothetical protein FPQ18DRAFT_342460 [Pyronema domesticum]|nr:hypothetical protein FPQ18DRAFT_342460 [Pyronema domesticum]
MTFSTLPLSLPLSTTVSVPPHNSISNAYTSQSLRLQRRHRITDVIDDFSWDHQHTSCRISTVEYIFQTTTIPNRRVTE